MPTINENKFKITIIYKNVDQRLRIKVNGLEIKKAHF